MRRRSRSTLFPYATLFRSGHLALLVETQGAGEADWWRGRGRPVAIGQSGWSAHQAEIAHNFGGSRRAEVSLEEGDQRSGAAGEAANVDLGRAIVVRDRSEE